METEENRTPINIEEEMKRSYLDYAMSVIVGRALPDVRDGLKPVHRRVLYAMHKTGNTGDKPYRKSARTVGTVIGRYHPHGDAAVYDTIVRLAQDFSMRYMLVDGQGNFGSVDGDPPAAMRYTEIRLERLAHEMLRDIDKETVDFTPNYDGSDEEPLVLPAAFPNLLVNGSSGIAVGMATNIPPHNLGEVVDAIKLIVENPEIELTELMNVLPGPDFPTAGTIHGVAGIQQAYATGRGRIKMRGRAAIEPDARRPDRQSIIIRELPYQVNKAQLIEEVAQLVRDKRIEGISDIRDESDRDGIRVAIDLKRGENPNIILNKLYKFTKLQSTFGVISLALVNGRPQLLPIKDMLRHFIAYRREVVVRRTAYDLRKAEERAHILEGLKVALDHLDEVIELIRKAKAPPEAKEALRLRFHFSDRQAQAILDMRLQRLTGLERRKIVEEFEETLKLIERLSHTGYIKRTPLSIYQKQHRGGKGRRGMTTREEDAVRHLFVASTHDYILVFTSGGRVHWLKVHALPEIGSAGKGRPVVNLIQIKPGHTVAAMIAVREFAEGHFVVLAARSGYIKKTPLSAFSRPRADGIIAVNIEGGDELLGAVLSGGDDEIFMASARGQSIRFHESDVRPMGRTARGVIGIRMSKDDSLVAMEVLSGRPEILSVTENGYGKRTPVEEYRLQGRGGQGIINIRTSRRNGNVAACMAIGKQDEILMITAQGKLIRFPVVGVSRMGRATQGVKLLQVDPGDVVASAIRTEEEAPQTEEETAEPGEE
jgi:DNA gyrase subunit A